jgi:hypothetical protein
MALGPDFDEWLWNALEPEWRAKATAGVYDEEMPSLRRLYLDVTAERARQTAYTEALVGARVVINKFTDEPEEAWLVWHQEG